MGERRHLGLHLDHRVHEFSLLLQDPPFDDIEPETRAWLRARYAEIVPVVLPAALRAVERGGPISPRCLTELRGVAIRSANEPGATFSTALRGSYPALAVFSAVMFELQPARPSQVVLAMTRATWVAHELGSCWVESWNRERARLDRAQGSLVPVGAVVAEGVVEAPVELIATGPELDETEQHMLTLTAYGLSNDDIAKQTNYSRQAVSWHLGKLMKAWNVQNRTALVAAAFVRGVLAARFRRRPSTPAQLEAAHRHPEVALAQPSEREDDDQHA